MTQLDLLADICARKHGDNPESAAAHARIAPTKEQTRERIYELALERGTYGITADEVAAAWGVSHNHVAPRISELRKRKRLVPTERKRPTRAGCDARVLVADVHAKEKP